VALTATRVAIAQLSQNCNPMTSYGYHVYKYLDTEYNPAMVRKIVTKFCVLLLFDDVCNIPMLCLCSLA